MRLCTPGRSGHAWVTTVEVRASSKGEEGGREGLGHHLCLRLRQPRSAAPRAVREQTTALRDLVFTEPTSSDLLIACGAADQDVFTCGGKVLVESAAVARPRAPGRSERARTSQVRHKGGSQPVWDGIVERGWRPAAWTALARLCQCLLEAAAAENVPAKQRATRAPRQQCAGTRGGTSLSELPARYPARLAEHVEADAAHEVWVRTSVGILRRHPQTTPKICAWASPG